MLFTAPSSSSQAHCTLPETCSKAAVNQCTEKGGRKKKKQTDAAVVVALRADTRAAANFKLKRN